VNVKLEIEEIKKKLQNQENNIELVFSYLDELLEKRKHTEPRKMGSTFQEGRCGCYVTSSYQFKLNKEIVNIVAFVATQI